MLTSTGLHDKAIKKSNHLIRITRVSLTTPFPLRNQLFANFIVGHDISWYLQKKSLNLNELKYLYIQPTRYKTILGVHPGRTRADSFFFRFCSWLGHHVLFCASPFWETIWISANGTCQSDLDYNSMGRSGFKSGRFYG